MCFAIVVAGETVVGAAFSMSPVVAGDPHDVMSGLYPHRPPAERARETPAVVAPAARNSHVEVLDLPWHRAQCLREAGGVPDDELAAPDVSALVLSLQEERVSPVLG